MFVVKRYILLFVFLITCFSFAKGNKTEYAILPFAYYNPATSFGFGAYSLFLFKENKNNDRSTLRTEISYTLKEQIIFRYKSKFFFDKSNLFVKSNVKKFISNFYGIGNSSDIEKESYSYFSTDLILNYTKQIFKKLSYSLLYDLDIIKIYKSEDNGLLESNGFAYTSSKFNNGIGLGFNYEEIGKKFFRNGISLDFGYIISSKLMGSSDNFSTLSIDSKYFIPYKQSSLNLQFSSRFSFDNVPFTKLSTLGGTHSLRGYPDKRFTDKNMMVFQSEYDLRIYKKIAGSIFYSFGDVFDPFTDLKFNKIKHGYGVGILYELLGTAIRVDIATSPEREIQVIATGSRAF